MNRGDIYVSQNLQSSALIELRISNRVKTTTRMSSPAFTHMGQVHRCSLTQPKSDYIQKAVRDAFRQEDPGGFTP